MAATPCCHGIALEEPHSLRQVLWISLIKGLQNGVIIAGHLYGLGLNETTIAQKLKSQGYKTHMVGKVSEAEFMHVFAGHQLLDSFAY